MAKQDTINMNPSLVLSGGIFLAIVTIVHIFYEGIIRPSAEAVIAAYGAAATGNIWVILKDFEQQACISIGLYCCFLMLYKSFRIKHEEPLYTMNFLAEDEDGEKADVEEVLKKLENSAFKDSGAMSTWITCIQRYINTQNVQHASDAISTSIESLAAQLESGNSMIRYVIWAIPSIGFVGTVRGIGAALAQAEEAVAGNISGMVDKLGVAFNSTLVSLVISIILMLLLHLLNNRQDQMVIKTQKTCEKHLLSHLHK
ncbi:MotA/TolQ/ExbB proton channel family protein [Thalassomonas viridans]|uniref:MotA/TolQ/ExbB proton channel family protein n=1 Tax=Thalassomonas viridans TaxID=137584 RepID=A0AAF0C9J7_9GAMM|nr:MotA/TolQ/ExbB proton channel family protein [Thalassomonas viridans]WDE05848.1 MotA/TolQ/ExbB proton channel family protein [Thalassomonas viridans]